MSSVQIISQLFAVLKKDEIEEDEIEKPTNPIVDLKPHQFILKDNQTGISFKKLFGNYL